MSLFKNRVPPLQIKTSTDDDYDDECVHGHICKPVETRFECCSCLSKIEKSHIQYAREPWDTGLCPGKEPRFLDHGEKYDDIDDTSEDHGIEDISREVPVEEHHDGERETEIVEPVDLYFPDSSESISDTEDTDREEERNERNEWIIFPLIQEDIKVESDEYESDNIRKGMRECPHPIRISPIEKCSRKINSGTDEGEEEFFWHRLFDSKSHLHPIEPVHCRKRKCVFHEKVIFHLHDSIVVSLLIWDDDIHDFWIDVPIRLLL